MSELGPRQQDIDRLPPRQRGLAIALELHRHEDPRNWRAKVDAIECPEARAVAEDYLGMMVKRINALRAAKKKTSSRGRA